MQGGAPWTSYLVAAVGLAVLVVRLQRLSRVRRLRLETLWIVPAVLVTALVASLVEYPPPDPATWIWLAFALGVGLGVGWRRAKLMRIAVDPATHRLNQQASPSALIFVVLLIVARQGLRYEAASLGLNILQVTGILLALMAGLVTATRAEMFVRARRMLATGTG